MNPEIVKAIAVTAELLGMELSVDAARVFAADLSEYPTDQVMVALTKCRREVRGRLTLADVIQRLEDGRPGAEEAWALWPKDERTSAIITEEIAQAGGVALALLSEGDTVAARMAFKETYSRAVQAARDARTPVRWFPSFGHDRYGRAAAIREAADRKRISADRAVRMLEQHAPEAAGELIGRPALAGPQPVGAFFGTIVRDDPSRRPELSEQAVGDARQQLAAVRKSLADA